MNTNTLWTMLFAAVGGVAFASWLRRKLHGEKQAHKAELQEWENEGGNLAPSLAVPDIVIIMR
jgi:hypothetical protein